MKEYKISEEVVQSLINYLSTQTYAEVYQVLPILLQLEQVITEEDKAIEEDAVNG